VLESLLGALLIFLLRVVGVSLITVRILLVGRGIEVWSAVIGFFEVLIYVVAIGLVVNDLTNIPAVLGYCLGFSVGTIVGIRLDRRLAFGFASVRVISREHGEDVASALRAAGFGATLSWGEGRDGRVAIITTVIPRRRMQAAMTTVRRIDEDAFLVVDEARAVHRGWLGLARPDV
jgi:uncharacterized protein YebE (UPF0316 family)